MSAVASPAHGHLAGAALRLLADDRLARRTADGDHEAFAVLYRRHYQALYRYSRAILGNEEDAADALQNTMAAALRALPGERREIRIKPWLFRIAHNLVANWHRDTGRHKSIPIDGLYELPNPTDDPPEQAESLEETRELREVIQRLPADRQQLLVLKFVERMPNAEIASVMGRTEGAVKALLHRTIESLKFQLAPSKAGKK